MYYGSSRHLSKRETDGGAYSSENFRGAVSNLHLHSLFKGHRGCVNSVSWSGDGLHVLSGSDDKKVSIWFPGAQSQRAWHGSSGIRSPLPLASFPTGHTSNIFCVRLLNNTLQSGSVVVTCAADGQVRLHTLGGGSQVVSRCLGVGHGRRAAHRLAVQQGDLSGDIHVFSSAGEDGVTRIYDVRLPCPCETSSFSAQTPRGKPLKLYALDWRPGKASELLTGGDDGVVRVWDLRFLREAPLQFYPPAVKKSPICTSAVFSADGGRIAAALNHEDSFIFDTQCSASQLPWAVGDSAPRNASVVVLSGSGGNVERIIPSKPLKPFPGPPPTNSFSFLPPQPPSSHPPPPFTILNDEESFLPYHSYCGEGGLTRLRGHVNRQTIKGISFFGPRHEYVLQGCDTGGIFIYDAFSGKALSKYQGDTLGAVNSLAPYPDPEVPFFLSSGLENTVKLWVFRPPQGYDAEEEEELEFEVELIDDGTEDDMEEVSTGSESEDDGFLDDEGSEIEAWELGGYDEDSSLFDGKSEEGED